MKLRLSELSAGTFLDRIRPLVLIVGIYLVAACTTPPMLDGAAPTSSHTTVSIALYGVGAPTPGGWYCTTKGRWMICVSEDPIDLTNDPDPIYVPWSVITQGWKFVSNKGIKVKGGGWHEYQVSDTQYTAWNKKDRKIYKYEINVTNGTDTVTWDPFIWNN